MTNQLPTPTADNLDEYLAAWMCIFNSHVPDSLQKESIEKIYDIASDIPFLAHVPPQDAAFVWSFASKYGVSKFPATRKETSKRWASAQETQAFINTLKQTETYIQENNIFINGAAQAIQAGIAAKTGDLFTFVKNYV